MSDAVVGDAFTEAGDAHGPDGSDGAAPSCAPSCPNGNPCSDHTQCASGVCTANACASPECAPSCPGGNPCGAPGDCASGICTDGLCASASTLTVSPSALSFTNPGGTPGFVACGTSPTPQSITIENTGTAPLTWWTSLGLGAASPYTLSTASSTPNCTEATPCTITDTSPFTLTVIGAAVPANAGVATYNDTLTIYSSAPGDLGHVVQLVESSYGAILSFSPPDQNFGAQPTAGSYGATIDILNSGNAPVVGAELTLGGSAEFSISTNTLSVPVTGASFMATFTPENTAAVQGGVGISVGSNPLCAPLPGVLTLEGSGSAAVISVTSSLNFNSGANGNGGTGISCGTTGPTLSAVVSNAGTTAAQITALTLAGGAASPYTLPQLSMLPITVTPGTPVNIQVVPKPVPSSAPPDEGLDDTLTITTNAAGDSPHLVALTETSAGAALSLTPSTVAFSSTPINQKASASMSLVNSGNIGAPVTFTSTNGAFTFQSGVVGAANSDVTPGVFFTPTAAMAYSATGTMTVATGTPLCSSGTPTVSFMLTGTGTTGGVSYTESPATIAFGKNTCGVSGGLGTPPGPMTVTLSNMSSSAASWNAALSGAGAGFFSLSATTGSVPPLGTMGGTTDFTVSANALGVTSDLTSNEVQFGITATLTIVVGTGTTQQTFSVPVTELPYGAFPAWSVASISQGQGGTNNFSLTNVSTDVVNFTLALTPSNDRYTLTPGSGNAGQNAPLAATVSNNYVFMTPPGINVAASFTTPATTAQCGALPAPLPVNGG